MSATSVVTLFTATILVAHVLLLCDQIIRDEKRCDQFLNSNKSRYNT